MNVDTTVPDEALTERTVMRAALEKWGERSQLDMLYEEVGELLTAIGHFQRGRCDRDAVASEIADVQIMLAQMAEIIGPEKVAVFRAQKIQRLAGRVGLAPVVREPTPCPGCAGDLAGLVDAVCAPCRDALTVAFAPEAPNGR
jgi:NTP pyrophosphatase (non-canonical NTP hydrolase)